MILGLCEGLFLSISFLSVFLNINIDIVIFIFLVFLNMLFSCLWPYLKHECFLYCLIEVFPKAVHKMFRRDWQRFSSEHHYHTKRQKIRCKGVFHICPGLEGNPCSCEFVLFSWKIYNVILLGFPHCLSTQVILNILYFSNCLPNIQRYLYCRNCFSTIFS